MRPTKMLPVRGSLREFQELDSSAQDLQSQPRTYHHVFFSRCSKKTLTKKVAGLICLALFCVGTVFLEYEMLLLFRAAFVVFAAACAFAVILGALYRAPEGDERGDGLHIRQRNRPRRFLLARSAGSGGFRELRTDESLQICANVNSGFDGILRRYSDEGADESEHHGTSSRHLISPLHWAKPPNPTYSPLDPQRPTRGI
jgi:hypothetical protein